MGNMVLSQEVKNRIIEFRQYLAGQRYSESTIKTYSSMLSHFFSFYKDLKPEDVCLADIKKYNYEYILKKNYSSSFQNQFINAIKKFYEKVYNKNLSIEDIERPRRGRILPKVLSKEEVALIIGSVRNIKHRAILSLIYSAGLRRGELINLKIRDIDSNRMLIVIRSAKGKNDRVIGLSKKILLLLRQYYKLYKPRYFLFEGQKGGKYTGSSINHIFQSAKRHVGIKVSGGVHILRHSFATHLHESGYDIRIIQELLGHKSSRTTEIYTHISTKSIKNVVSPFDDLD